MDNIITASQALNQSRQKIEELGFPLGITFNSRNEVEAFANAKIEKRQQAYPSGFKFNCWKSHTNIIPHTNVILYDWEIKKLDDSAFPVTITFNRYSDISNFAYGIVGEYVPENVNNEFDVNAWWKQKKKEERKQYFKELKKKSKRVILSFGIVAAVTALILIIPSISSSKEEKQSSNNEQSVNNYTYTSQNQSESTPKYVVFHTDQDVISYTYNTFATRDGMYRFRVDSWFQWTINGTPVRGRVQIVNIINKHTARIRLYSDDTKTTMIVNSETETISDGDDVYYIVK